MKVLFFGTPDVAVPYLEWLHFQQEIVGVVCQPDKPQGRGYLVSPSPVKQFALENNLPLFQPTGPWTADVVQSLVRTDADVGLVVAYGRLLPPEVLTAPRLGCINIHFSLLPKYRGAAPVQWALIKGETETGVTSFWLDPHLDAGPIFHQVRVPIDAGDNTQALRAKLAEAGLKVLEMTTSDLESGRPVRRAQEGEVIKAPRLKKEDGKIEWNQPSVAIVNLVRGVSEWPGAHTSFYTPDGNRLLKVLKASVAPVASALRPGQIVEARAEKGIIVKTADGGVCLMEIQPEGKKTMSAWAFWQGARLKEGDQLG